MLANRDPRLAASDRDTPQATVLRDEQEGTVTCVSSCEASSYWEWTEEPGAMQPAAALNALLGFVVLAGLLAASVALGLVQ